MGANKAALPPGRALAPRIPDWADPVEGGEILALVLLQIGPEIMFVAALVAPVTMARGELGRIMPTWTERLCILRLSECACLVCAGVLLLLLLLVLLLCVAIVVASGLRGVIGVLFDVGLRRGELLNEEPGWGL